MNNQEQFDKIEQILDDVETSINKLDLQIPVWEYYCDIGYYHMWAVRPVSSRSFNSPLLFHINNQREAEALCNILNSFSDLANSVQKFRNNDLLGELVDLRSTADYSELCNKWQDIRDLLTEE